MLALVLAGVLAGVAGAVPGTSALLPPSRAELEGLPSARDLPGDRGGRADRASDEPGSARIPDASKGERVEPKKPEPSKTKTVEPSKQTEATGPADVIREPAPRVEPSRSKVAPAIVLVGSVALGVVGAVYVARTMEAIDKTPGTNKVQTVQGQTITVPDIDAVREQEREVLTNGIIATVALSSALAGLLTSTLLIIAD